MIFNESDGEYVVSVPHSYLYVDGCTLFDASKTHLILLCKIKVCVTDYTKEREVISEFYIPFIEDKEILENPTSPLSQEAAKMAGYMNLTIWEWSYEWLDDWVEFCFMPYNNFVLS